MTRSVAPVPRWAIYSTFFFSLVGLAISIYLTNAHFNGTQDLFCSDSGFVNCAKVTTSAQSYFLGIPVAVLGLCGYSVLCVINSPWAWHLKNYWVHVARFVIVIGSMCFVLWLLSAELLIIKNICLYCTGVHVITFILFVIMAIVCPTQLGWGTSRSE
jgi:uncharacterized membrane protein